jgi:BirA family transcriptional regulator, biotin operon repressor / biotin---[acetyl-CoA-carboxylase] ligase
MQVIHSHFSKLVSTNDYAKQMISTFPKDTMTVIIADAQTLGRGQYSKKWHSPPHLNLYASFCFFIEPNEDPFIFTRFMAEATIRMLKKFEIEARLKWPNDLFVSQKKIAGILTETVSFEKEIGTIVGIGLNVNMDVAELKNIDQEATSIFKETGKISSVHEVLLLLEEEFLSYFQK